MAVFLLCVDHEGERLQAHDPAHSDTHAQICATLITDNTKTGLRSDCEVLLDIKDTLRGDRPTDGDNLTNRQNAWDALNWGDTNVAFSSWLGITTSGAGANERVTAISLGTGLRGELPATVEGNGGAGLSALESLSIRSNNATWGPLTGTIPDWIGNLTGLTVLDLNGNQLEGHIPDGLSDLTNLTQLTLQDNQLEGQLPDLASLTALQNLHVGNNQLEQGPLPDLSNLTDLQILGLNHNQFTGSIPTWISNLTSLTQLYLNDNQLTGQIPAGIGGLSGLISLSLHNNRLTGQIPASLGSLSNLNYLVLDSNRLTGSVPSELGNLGSLFNLSLHNNRLTGSIPSDLGSLTNLTQLRLENNQLTGQIPSELGSLTRLLHLRLQDNQLTGQIPSELGRLTNLNSLYVQRNRLTGNIPDLSALTGLWWLYLHDNRLTGNAPNLNNASNLNSLGLGGNDLDLDWSTFGSSGSVNLETGHNMYYLYLHDSGLEGPIPDWIGANHTNLIEFWLQYNSITGDVPANFTNLTNLTALRLHGNTLTGFGALDELEGLTTLMLPVPADSGGGISIRTDGDPIYVGVQSTSLPAGSDLTSTRLWFDGSPVIAPGVIGSAPNPGVVEGSAVDITVRFRNADGELVSALSAPVTVCVAAPVGSAGAGEELVLLKHNDDEGWTVLESADPPSAYDPGDGNVAVCGSTDSFSLFVPAVVASSDLEPTPVPGRSALARISRIEPSIRSLTVSQGEAVTLRFDIYGRQGILDNGLGEELDFEWDDGSAGGSFKPSDRANSIVYTAPENPGTYTVTTDSPFDACLSGDDSEDRCIASFTITVRRPSAVSDERPAPKNPVGEIPSVLADAEGRQYEVFTPEEGGYFDGGEVTLSAEPGVVPDLEIIGLRAASAGSASNVGMTRHRYTLVGDRFDVLAVDATETSISSYVLNAPLEVCVPLPPAARQNISDVAIVVNNPDGTLTVLSASVRITGSSGVNVCGKLSTLPASVAVGTAGSPKAIPTATPDPDAIADPDTGGREFSWILVLLAMIVGGVVVAICVGGVVRERSG